MHVAGLASVRAEMPAVLDRVESGDAVVVTRHGRMSAIVLPIEWARRLLLENPSLAEDLIGSEMADFSNPSGDVPRSRRNKPTSRRTTAA